MAGDLRALRADHENLEGAHAHLAELVASGELKGLLIVEIGKDSMVGWSRFGEVQRSEMALVGAMMSYTAASASLGKE